MKKIAMLIAAAILAYGGVALATFAEADDAPGGVVMGWLLIGGALAMGLKALLRSNSSDHVG